MEKNKAIQWWNNLTFEEQMKKKNEYFCEDVLLSDLDNVDIENIYVFYHWVV